LSYNDFVVNKKGNDMKTLNALTTKIQNALSLNQYETELLLNLVDLKLQSFKENYSIIRDPMETKIGSLELIAIQLESHLNAIKGN
jgi:hypothetical protein